LPSGNETLMVFLDVLIFSINWREDVMSAYANFAGFFISGEKNHPAAPSIAKIKIAAAKYFHLLFNLLTGANSCKGSASVLIACNNFEISWSIILSGKIDCSDPIDSSILRASATMRCLLGLRLSQFS